VSRLFEPLTLRGTTFRNRAWVAPMCQYSSVDGCPGDWHLVHLGQFAVGGAGLVLTEATAVVPEGRISPYDAGIWNDDQAAAYRRISSFVRESGAVPGIQLGHAGRMASWRRPWLGTGPVDPADGGWQPLGPSDAPYEGLAAPRAMTPAEVAAVPAQFAAAARRAEAAGFEVIELHAAHGYLLHQFLSPLSNFRDDGYGGGFDSRVRLTLEVVDAVRGVWPDRFPLLLRVSATDWADGGWTVEETVELARRVAARGVDLVDVSSGGNVTHQRITVGPGYQVPFARAVREGAGVPTGAVGLITEPAQAEQVLVDGAADAVLLARELLRDPHWPLRAAHALRADAAAAAWPPPYERARWR